MAMRVTVTVSVTASLEASGADPSFSDLAMFASGAASFAATLSTIQEPPLAQPGAAALPRRRRPAFRPSVFIAPPVEPIAARRRRRDAEALLLVGAL